MSNKELESKRDKAIKEYQSSKRIGDKHYMEYWWEQYLYYNRLVAESNK